jgi:hypothetical protein
MVVLPAPFCPMMTSRSSGLTERDTFSRICFSLKQSQPSRSSATAARAPAGAGGRKLSAHFRRRPRRHAIRESDS